MRESKGPVTKATGEKFWLETAIPFAIPAGETITAFNVQAIERGVSPIVYSTDALFGGVVEKAIDAPNNLVAARVIADPGGTTVGEYLVEFEIITDGGTKFEIEIFLNVVSQRTPVLYVTKKEQETFPVGVDFTDVLATGEAVSSGTVEAVEKFAGADTTLILFTSGTAVVGSDVVTGQAKPLDDGTQVNVHTVKYTAITDAGNTLIEWAEVEVEASQTTEP